MPTTTQPDLDTDALVVSADVKRTALAAGRTPKQAEAAALDAFTAHRSRQAAAHDARTWCPTGTCAYCTPRSQP